MILIIAGWMLLYLITVKLFYYCDHMFGARPATVMSSLVFPGELETEAPLLFLMHKVTSSYVKPPKTKCGPLASLRLQTNKPALYYLIRFACYFEKQRNNLKVFLLLAFLVFIPQMWIEKFIFCLKGTEVLPTAEYV